MSDQRTTPRTSAPKKSSPPKAAAARANGAKSKGPLTAAGKSISSQNAIKHGCYVNAILLCNEEPEKWEALLLDFITRFQPVGQAELGLVEEMASAHWRMRRYWFAESATLDIEMTRQEASIEKLYGPIPQPARLSLAIAHFTSKSEPEQGALAFYHRIESRLRRHYSRALSDLLKIQQLRNQTQPAAAPPESEIKNDETNPPLPQPPASQPLAASAAKPRSTPPPETNLSHRVDSPPPARATGSRDMLESGMLIKHHGYYS